MQKHSRSLAIIIILSVSILLLASTERVESYIDTTNPHSEGDFDPGGESFCAICHVGFPAADSSAEVDRVVDNYRCIVCHYSLSQDYRSLVNSTIHSPHRTTACTRCHDTFHATHWRWMSRYYTDVRGRYGCWRAHAAVTHDYNPPQGATIYFLDTYYLNQTAPKSFNLVWRPWFYDSLLPGTQELNVYTYVFVDPYTGDVDAIPSTEPYLVCMKCHFVNKATRTNMYSTYFVDHPAVCYSCHSNTTGYTSTYILEPHAVMDHAVTSSWNSCRTCHANVAQSVDNSIHGHKGVGCRCHSMIHVSMYNGSASWVYMYPSPGTKNYFSPECTMCHFVHGGTTDVTWWRTVFFYNTNNASTYNVPIYPFSTPSGLKYANIFYLMRNGDATIISGPELKLATCFNCHFIAGSSGGAAAAEFSGYIPLPENIFRELEDPHAIGSLSESTMDEGILSRPHRYLLVSIGVLLLVLLLLVFLSRGLKNNRINY